MMMISFLRIICVIGIYDAIFFMALRYVPNTVVPNKPIFVSYITSTINAVLTTVCSTVLIITSASVNDISIFLEIFIAYFLYDLGLVAFDVLSSIEIIHHILVIAVCLVYTFGSETMHEIVSPYVPYITLVEVSTIFLNARWFMSALRWSDVHPKIYHRINIAFATSFFITRIIIFPDVLWIFHKNHSHDTIYFDGEHEHDMFTRYMWMCVYAFFILLVMLQGFWFNKIVNMISRRIVKKLK